MKSDNYLNLCLAQAAKSPLRYRHGCIVVRGGKLIGQGYNDHRSGYDGGALKSGRLLLRASPGTGAHLNSKQKFEKGEAQTFTPFETMVGGGGTMVGGGGRLANTPLSMHSEMMAIHSALSASSTVACSAVSSHKPCFKLSGSSKRKARLQREVVKTYVETVCKAAIAQPAANQSDAKSQVQEWRFESTASRSLYIGMPCGIECPAKKPRAAAQWQEQHQRQSQWAAQLQASTVCT